MPVPPPAPPPSGLPPFLEESAAELGLEVRAILPAGRLPDEVLERHQAWLDAGFAGEMDYLQSQAPAAADLRAWKPWAGAAVLFALPYARAAGSFRGGGRVARYALGQDYHHRLGRQLQRLGRRLRKAGEIARFRACVDAAPVLEREWALRGNLGFRGKNTLILDPALGPWLLLGELLVDVEWPTWAPPAPSPTCGSCTRCLDACPTGAFPAPYQLDARKCISYLTIELQGRIPIELRSAMADWVFGCDVCLEVCPFGSEAADQGASWGRLAALDALRLEDLLALTEAEFEAAFRGSPLRRPGWAGLLRNACVALGNLGHGGAALATALHHPAPVVRGHAAWALGRLGERGPLETARGNETDPLAKDEIEAALASFGNSRA
ncbi:MAG TPA: tRNA epoxyqueuosine(34) reductase QueG [Planctomycetota bacterium]